MVATANISFAIAAEGDVRATSGIPVSQQDMAVTAASAASTITAPNSGICVITATLGNVRAAFGIAPTVTATTGWLIINGTTREFGHIPPGYKVAVIDSA